MRRSRRRQSPGRGDDGAINFKNSYKTGSSRRSNNNNNSNNKEQWEKARTTRVECSSGKLHSKIQKTLLAFETTTSIYDIFENFQILEHMSPSKLLLIL